MFGRTRRSLGRLVDESKEAAGDLPAVLSDRRAAGYWLATAHKAQAALALLLLLGWLVLPTVRDTLLGWVLPDKTTYHFFGLAKRTRRNPHLQTARTVANTVYWVGGSGLVLLALWLHLPRARRWAETREVGRSSPAAPTGLPRGEDLASARTLARTAVEPPTAPAPTPAPGAEPAPGDVLVDRYRLVAELGRGGMGVVFHAHDLLLGRDVALKALPGDMASDAELDQRLRQEARALAQLMHPHIVQIFDLIHAGRGRFISMELVRGGSLEDLTARGRPPLPRLLTLASQMAEALSYSHAQGVVHRDFKPANVLLGTDGEVKVTDFGLAKLVDRPSVLTQAGMVMGSPDYMSPEQAAGKPSGPATDTYALGITLYQLATGRVPFVGELAQVLAQQITQPPTPPHLLVEGVLPELEALILQMLAKSAEARPAMDEVRQRLAALARAHGDRAAGD